MHFLPAECLAVSALCQRASTCAGWLVVSCVRMIHSSRLRSRDDLNMRSPRKHGGCQQRRQAGTNPATPWCELKQTKAALQYQIHLHSALVVCVSICYRHISHTVCLYSVLYQAERPLLIGRIARLRRLLKISLNVGTYFKMRSVPDLHRHGRYGRVFLHVYDYAGQKQAHNNKTHHLKPQMATWYPPPVGSYYYVCVRTVCVFRVYGDAKG